MDKAGFLLAVLCAMIHGCARHAGTSTSATGQAPLVLERTIPLPTVAGPVERNGIAGRLDHLAYDTATHRLFLAAFSKGSLEVIDLDQGKLVNTIEDIPEAQGVAVSPTLGRVYVTSGDKGTIQSFDTSTLKQAGSASVIEDADNVRFDARTGNIMVGGGSRTAGAIIVLEPAALTKIAEIALPSHAESFQLNPVGPRIYVNIPGDKYSDKDGAIVVTDRDKGTALATWTLQGAARNFAMAIDPVQHRIFVISRKPAIVTVFDSSTGHVLGTNPCAPDCDDVFYDVKTHLLMVIGGGRRTTDRAGEPVTHDQPGTLDVFAATEGGQLDRLTSYPLPPHARTGLFVPDRRMLYIAVPVQNNQPAEIREYRVRD